MLFFRSLFPFPLTAGSGSASSRDGFRKAKSLAAVFRLELPHCCANPVALLPPDVELPKPVYELFKPNVLRPELKEELIAAEDDKFEVVDVDEGGPDEEEPLIWLWAPLFPPEGGFNAFLFVSWA